MDTKSSRERRDREMLALYMSGLTASALSGRFSVSVDRVLQTICGAQLESARQEMAQEYRARIRSADDVDRPWPAASVVRALFTGARAVVDSAPASRLQFEPC